MFRSGVRAASTNNLKSQVTTGTTGSIAGLSDAQNRVARQLMTDFTTAGMSRAGAAGMIGNWVQESSLNPDEPGGYMAQWGGARLASLVSFASNQGKAPSDVDAQAAFAVHELKTGYGSLWALLQTTKSPRAAAIAISNQYERPLASAANLPHRISAAQQAFGALGASAGASQPGGPLSAGGLISLTGDILSGNFSDIGARLAMVGVTLIKDVALGIGDFIVIPFWHWNQRAIMFYYQQELMPTGNTTWTVLPWTAAFWGFGYWLLFTDPDAGNLKPAPVRGTRLARHVRSAQAVPARRSLIKPGDVSTKTPRKPTPTLSRALVTEMGKMQVTRSMPVRVTGEHATRRETSSRESIKRAGTVGSATESSHHTTRSSPDANDRTGDNPLPNRGGGSPRRAGQSRTGRYPPRRG